VLLRNLTADADRPIWPLGNMYDASPASQKLGTHPGIAAITAQLSGANELRIWHDQIQYKPQERGARTDLAIRMHRNNPVHTEPMVIQVTYKHFSIE
jgi:hypothetical protein